MKTSWEQTRSLIKAIPRLTVNHRFGASLLITSQVTFRDTREEFESEAGDPPRPVLLIGNYLTSYPQRSKTAANTIYLEVDQHPTVVVQHSPTLLPSPPKDTTPKYYLGFIPRQTTTNAYHLTSYVESCQLARREPLVV